MSPVASRGRSLGGLHDPWAQASGHCCAAAAPEPHDDPGDREDWRERAGQEHDDLPQDAAAAALVKGANPLRRAIARERIGQAARRAVAIVDHDGGDIVAARIAQLHAPGCGSALTAILALTAIWALATLSALGLQRG